MNCNFFNYSAQSFYQSKIVQALEEVTKTASLDCVMDQSEYVANDEPLPISSENPEGPKQKLVYFSENYDFIKKLAQIDLFSNLYIIATAISTLAAAVLFVTSPLSVVPVIVIVAAVVFLGMGVWNRHVVNCAIRDIKISHVERMKEMCSYLCCFSIRNSLDPSQMSDSDKGDYDTFFRKKGNGFFLETPVKFEIIKLIKSEWLKVHFANEKKTVYHKIIQSLYLDYFKIQIKD